MIGHELERVDGLDDFGLERSRLAIELSSSDVRETQSHVGDTIRSPNLNPGDDVREVMLDQEQAEVVLDYLERYEYASLPHVTLALLWHTMMRLGAAQSLDLGDYSPEAQCLTVEHRPETGTPIKKGSQGERLVALSGELCMLLGDWYAISGRT